MKIVMKVMCVFIALSALSSEAFCQSRGCNTPVECYEKSLQNLQQARSEMSALTKDFQEKIEMLEKKIVPVGTVAPYFGNTAPAGWLMCNGGAIPSGSDYYAIREMVGNNTPDLRGYFLRGLDTSGSVDPEKGRTVGSKQADALLKNHTHPLPGVVKK